MMNIKEIAEWRIVDENAKTVKAFAAHGKSTGNRGNKLASPTYREIVVIEAFDRGGFPPVKINFVIDSGYQGFAF